MDALAFFPSSVTDIDPSARKVTQRGSHEAETQPKVSMRPDLTSTAAFLPASRRERRLPSMEFSTPVSAAEADEFLLLPPPPVLLPPTGGGVSGKKLGARRDQPRVFSGPATGVSGKASAMTARAMSLIYYLGCSCGLVL